ncbi:MAG TPA: hypothetical protein VG055_09360 [Planctomycetaceae bacterium]|jgi:hypothetical protein|nr:hypothetical protein [Planctomycetaceae bacterium]
MSDEPKKRSRAWIWWALILMFVLYPLSVGPSMRLASSSDSWLQFHSIVFEPLFWVSEQSETIDSAFGWYSRVWAREETEGQRLHGMWERLEKVNLDPDVSKDHLIKLFGPPDLEWDNFQFWGEFNAVDDKGKEGPRHVFAAIYDGGKLNAYHKVRPIFVDGSAIRMEDFGLMTWRPDEKRYKSAAEK